MNQTAFFRPAPENKVQRPPLSRPARQSPGRPALPLFLRARAAGQSDPAEGEARRIGAAPEKKGGPRAAPAEAGGRLPAGFNSGHGRPLGDQSRSRLERRLGGEFADVRVHDDPAAHRLARAYGANALTHGDDIYFSQGRYRPETAGGEQLLAHELVHVLQQRAAGRETVQFDLMQSMPTLLGAFDIEMATRLPPQRTGMEGHLRFHPDPLGPYSAQIGLVQVVNVTDVGGSSTTAGDPFDWSGTSEQARNELMTTGAGAADPGWFIDSNTAANPQGSSIEPDYIEHFISPAPDNQYGFLRSETDLQQASLYDYPGTTSPTHELDFDFETVAKGKDTQTVYGALHWGFQIRRGTVNNEYAFTADATSANFEEALERYRGYYVHEPLVIYFDTAASIPLPGEAGKIDGVLDYLNTYGDTVMRIEGFADERGGRRDNLALADARANAVATLFLDRGVSASRITSVIGRGETTGFAPGRTEGSLRANRRVMVRFERTASTPIATP